MKDKTQGPLKKKKNKQPDKNEQKHVHKEENKESHKDKKKFDQTSKKEKEDNIGDSLEHKKMIKTENSSFIFTQSLSEVKMSIPLLQMMKIK